MALGYPLSYIYFILIEFFIVLYFFQIDMDLFSLQWTSNKGFTSFYSLAHSLEHSLETTKEIVGLRKLAATPYVYNIGTLLGDYHPTKWTLIINFPGDLVLFICQFPEPLLHRT